MMDEDNRLTGHSLPWGFWSGVIGFTALKLWLIAAQRLCALPHNFQDDRLFIYLARSILHGEWLGIYNHLTLAKNPFYPLWIAVNFWTGIPLVLSEHLLYILACLLAVVALRPLLKHWGYLLPIFAVLLFNPGSFGLLEMLRVAREGIYPALTLIVVASAIGLVLRLEGSTGRVLPWSLGLGVSLTAFWLTREEEIWILPTLGLLAGYGLLKLRPFNRKILARYGLVWGLAAALPLCGILLVSWLNWKSYGLFAITESDSAAFKAAYGAMTRVKSDRWLAQVPVSHQARRRIYRVSPAFSELRSFLEGKIGDRWAAHGFRDEAYRGEIQGGWYIWALRDAVSAAGHYSHGRFPREYYKRLAREINRACDKGQLDCYPARASMMPPWNPSYLQPFGLALLESGYSLTRFRGVQVEWYDRSLGMEVDTRIFRDLTREQLCRADEETIISGRLFSENQHPGFMLRGYFNEEVYFTLEPVERLTVTTDLPAGVEAGAPGSGFVIRALCPYSCTLIIDEQGDDPLRLEIVPGIKEHWVNGARSHLYIQSVSQIFMLPEQQKVNRFKLDVLKKIILLYQNLVPWVMLLAMLAFAYLGLTWLTARRNGSVWWIAAALLAGVAVRIVLVSLLHVTSFRAITTVYLSPAYPLMLLFITLVWIAAGSDLAVRFGASRISKPRHTPSPHDA